MKELELKDGSKLPRVCSFKYKNHEIDVFTTKQNVYVSDRNGKRIETRILFRFNCDTIFENVNFSPKFIMHPNFYVCDANDLTIKLQSIYEKLMKHYNDNIPMHEFFVNYIPYPLKLMAREQKYIPNIW